MRVKTVPRQRIIQRNRENDSVPEAAAAPQESRQSSQSNERKETSNNAGSTSRTSSNHASSSFPYSRNLNTGQSKKPLESEEERIRAYRKMVLDIAMNNMDGIPEQDLPTYLSMAGPSRRRYWRSRVGQQNNNVSNSDNNNVLMPNANLVNCCSLTNCSCMEHLNSCEDKLNGSSSDDDRSIEAVNLCKKDCHEEDSSNTGGGSDEKLKDTFLYKIMTDPTFLENIQKHKQSKKYMCQFCKQEFMNSDELADHMDVKKDESNQVVCCACKKTFAQKRYLRYHQRCHSERTKFTCDICTKKYTRLDNLTRHSAFHVNPDKFSCTYCEKAFARKDLLNKHLKCHDKYRFFCELCHKYFKGPVTLDNHKKIFHATS